MHIRNAISITALALAIAALVGCNTKTGGDAPKGQSTGQVLAEVNGTNITTDDFKKEVDNLPPYLKPMTESLDGKKEMLETMVIRELILQQAKKDGIDTSKAVAEKLEDLKKRIIVDTFLKKKVEEQANLSDTELQKFYDQNKEKFRSGDQIKASHILVKDEKKAQEILAQLKGGASFEELEKKNSVDAAGAKGGDLGWFSKGSMIPEFEKAAFALKEGETSGIVKTKYGFHIIKLTGKRAAGILPFAEVRDQIKAAMAPEKQQEIFKKLKEDLKKSSKYTIKEDVLKGLDGKGTAAEAKTAAEPKPAGGEAKTK
ncbi:MAG TPA: peptidylprolyl isomerase [Geobacteraceae bacterium]